MEPARVAWWKQTITSTTFSSFSVLMWAYNHAFLSPSCFGVLKAGLNIVWHIRKVGLVLTCSNLSKQSSDQLSHFNSAVAYEF